VAEAALDRGPEDRAWWSRAPDWLKAAASATTALGILTYAVLRVDYALFYDRFGLKPEDVGLGQAELISQSVAGVVVILVLLFVELVLLAVTVTILGLLGRESVRAFRDTRRRYGTLAAVLAPSVLVAVIVGLLVGATPAGPWLLLVVSPFAAWFLWRVSRGPVTSTALLYGGLGSVVLALSVAFALSPQWTLVGLGGLLVLSALVKRWSSRNEVETPKEVAAEPEPEPPAATEERYEPRGPSPRFRKVVLGLAVAMTVVLAETLLALSAVSDANYVQSGHAVQPTLLGMPIVSWGARAVDVVWTGEPPAGATALVDHCLLYLGQSGGSVLLFDHDVGRTIRLSSGSVILSIQPSADYEQVCPR
jgi:hypothetical protein